MPPSLNFCIIDMRTERLILVATTLDHAKAELESLEEFSSALNVEVPADWPPGEYDRKAQEFFRDRLEVGGQAVAGWYSWYAILPASPGNRATVIGAGGYLGPPDGAGEVEIGYSLVPAWQGQGYATELVDALVTRALDDERVRRIIAHAAPDNNPSCAVLERAGFHCAASEPGPGGLLYELVRS